MHVASFDVHEFFVNDRHPMYVQRWKTLEREANEADRSAILVHGGAHTGVCWTTCPDGRPGWAKLLARRGWTVYVVDWPGMGRSRREDNFIVAGAQPVIDALCTLMEEVGPATIVAHSIGAAIAVKAVEKRPQCVEALVAIAPAPMGNLKAPRPLFPLDRPVWFDDATAERYFANAERFPAAAMDAYRRSLSDFSPSIMNAVASRDGSNALVVGEPGSLRSLPGLVVAGEQDDLVPRNVSMAVAEFLGAEHVLTGSDWDLPGFGHMIPIEVGSEQVLARICEWLNAATTHT